jgi:outer membrane protein TolC
MLALVNVLPQYSIAASSDAVVGAPVPPGALNQLREETAQIPGAIFLDDDKVIVKPPVLKALILLNRTQSPYSLESTGSQPISLEEALRHALGNNFDVNITRTSSQAAKWAYYGSLGGFLPDVAIGVTDQGLAGKYASPFGLLSQINTNYLSMPAVMQWNFFKGGATLYGALASKHQYQAAQAHVNGTTNDILLDATDLYYQLVLNDILLQIRVKAVETSKALLLRNQIEYENGANTKLDVLQATAQLSRDRQSLISQQVARRESAVKLARAINMDTSVDLTTSDKLVGKIRLVDENIAIGNLLQIAVENRPELKKYEQLRLAAKDAIRVAFAALLPQAFGTAGAITTGANVTSASLPGGASSAAGGLFTGGGFGGSTAAGASVTSGSKKFTMAEIFQIGMGVQWNIGGMGLTEAATVQQAKYQARKAQLDFSKELTLIYQEVHDAYLGVMEAENLIQETTDAVNASQEELNVATIRLEESVGTDLEVVNAQRDFTDALINKAGALIKFNTSEAKLLRAIGRISLPTLTASRPLTK